MRSSNGQTQSETITAIDPIQALQSFLKEYSALDVMQHATTVIKTIGDSQSEFSLSNPDDMEKLKAVHFTNHLSVLMYHLRIFE